MNPRPLIAAALALMTAGTPDPAPYVPDELPLSESVRTYLLSLRPAGDSGKGSNSRSA